MKPKRSEPAVSHGQKRLPAVFAGLFGAFLGLLLLKFGNVPIMEDVATPFPWVGNSTPFEQGVKPPANIWEFLFNCPWPVEWAYWLLAGVAILGICVVRMRPAVPRWLVVLPLVWLVWQFMATTQSVDPRLSWLTMKHFAGCLVCFYLGLFSLARVDRLTWFWFGMICGFSLVLASGLDQHFGGMERYRRFFFSQLELYPPAQPVKPEFLKRIASDRIYSTLFYPNVLAGALLLLLPVMMTAASDVASRLRVTHKAIQCAVLLLMAAGASWLYLADSKIGLIWMIAVSLAALVAVPRWLLAGLVGAAGLACLFWSGSKGGWLLMLLLGLITLLRFPFGKLFKIGMLSLVLLGGLTGFFWKYSAFFKKGATSVSARFDYWRAAVQTTREQPSLGTGPGTFAIAYQKVKRPESEMARLVHNDYLEQASDSGLPGFVMYAALIMGGLVCGFPRSRIAHAQKAERSESDRPKQKAGIGERESHWIAFAVWLGLLGWALQGLFEFGLYIPALAWPAFAFLGWLLGRKPIDKPESES